MATRGAGEAKAAPSEEPLEEPRSTAPRPREQAPSPAAASSGAVKPAALSPAHPALVLNLPKVSAEVAAKASKLMAEEVANFEKQLQRKLRALEAQKLPEGHPGRSCWCFAPDYGSKVSVIVARKASPRPRRVRVSGKGFCGVLRRCALQRQGEARQGHVAARPPPFTSAGARGRESHSAVVRRRPSSRLVCGQNLLRGKASAFAEELGGCRLFCHFSIVEIILNALL